LLHAVDVHCLALVPNVFPLLQPPASAAAAAAAHSMFVDCRRR
jgi:hypothetical protein